MKTFDEVLARFNTIQFNDPFDLIVAIANGGIIPAAIINQRLNAEIQIIKINFRDAQQKPRYASPELLAPVNFEYESRTILLVDDRVKTGATIQLAKEILEPRAGLVKTFAVNGPADYSLYNENCFKFPWLL